MPGSGATSFGGALKGSLSAVAAGSSKDGAILSAMPCSPVISRLPLLIQTVSFNIILWKCLRRSMVSKSFCGEWRDW